MFVLRLPLQVVGHRWLGTKASRLRVVVVSLASRALALRGTPVWYAAHSRILPVPPALGAALAVLLVHRHRFVLKKLVACVVCEGAVQLPGLGQSSCRCQSGAHSFSRIRV